MASSMRTYDPGTDEDHTIVTQDVSGTIYRTRRSVLTRYESRIRTIINNCTDFSRQIFLDYNGRVFREALDFMRYRKVLWKCQYNDSKQLNINEFAPPADMRDVRALYIIIKCFIKRVINRKAYFKSARARPTTRRWPRPFMVHGRRRRLLTW